MSTFSLVVIYSTGQMTGMAVDVESQTPRLASIWGGLSCPAIRPVALYMVYRVVRAIRIPVIGIGGIRDTRAVLEFLIAGDRAVQVGTANFVNPRASVDIVEGLSRFCKDRGISSIDQIVRLVETRPGVHRAQLPHVN